MYAKEAELVNEEFLMNENTYNLKIGGFGGFDYINSIPEYIKKVYPPERRKATGNYIKGLSSQKEQALKRKLKYDVNPLHCKVCGTQIPYQKFVKLKQNYKNVFCSKSCSAKHSNKGRNRHI